MLHNVALTVFYTDLYTSAWKRIHFVAKVMHKSGDIMLKSLPLGLYTESIWENII